MNARQIKNILSHHKTTKKYFINVFPSDMLPNKITRFPACFISNIDPSYLEGSHWVSFYIPSADRVEFFDSYGHPPDFFQGPISDFASRYSQVIYNPLTLQTNVTAVCGQYALFFLICKCRGESMKKFLSRFVTENMSNDQRVYNFVAKRFRVYVNFYQ